MIVSKCLEYFLGFALYFHTSNTFTGQSICLQHPLKNRGKPKHKRSLSFTNFLVFLKNRQISQIKKYFSRICGRIPNFDLLLLRKKGPRKLGYELRYKGRECAVFATGKTDDDCILNFYGAFLAFIVKNIDCYTEIIEQLAENCINKKSRCVDIF